MIVIGSYRDLQPGHRGWGILDYEGTGSLLEQPFVVVRPATIEEWRQCVLEQRGTPARFVPPPHARFYWVHTD